jgi:hypothetical protein
MQNSDRLIGGIVPLSHLFPTKRSREGREKIAASGASIQVQTDSYVCVFFKKNKN